MYRRDTPAPGTGGTAIRWSTDPPEESLMDGLNSAFASVRVRETKFYNPLLGLHDVNYIVVAQRAPSCQPGSFTAEHLARPSAAAKVASNE